MVNYEIDLIFCRHHLDSYRSVVDRYVFLGVKSTLTLTVIEGVLFLCVFMDVKMLHNKPKVGSKGLYQEFKRNRCGLDHRKDPTLCLTYYIHWKTPAIVTAKSREVIRNF